MPNLEYLSFVCCKTHLHLLLEGEILYLSGLKKLKRSSYEATNLNTGKHRLTPLLKMRHIHHTYIEIFNLAYVNPDYVWSLPRLKLTGLGLNSVPEEMWIEFVMRLPTLKCLHVIGGYQNVVFVKRTHI